MIAFEPMTAPTNALVSGQDLKLLQPGEGYEASFSIRVTDVNEPGETQVSADEFRQLFDRVSNWGRWGPDDERGALNYLTPRRSQRPPASCAAGGRSA